MDIVEHRKQTNREGMVGIGACVWGRLQDMMNCNNDYLFFILP